MLRVLRRSSTNVSISVDTEEILRAEYSPTHSVSERGEGSYTDKHRWKKMNTDGKEMNALFLIGVYPSPIGVHLCKILRA
jgi:hypothetical protein